MPNSIINVNVSNFSYPLYRTKLHATQPNFGNSAQNQQTEKTNKKLVHAVGGVLVGPGDASVVFRAKNKSNSKLISALQKQCSKLSSEIKSINAEKEALQKSLEEANKLLQDTQGSLQETKETAEDLNLKLNGILETNPGVERTYVDRLAEKYRVIAENAALGYNPMEPLENGKQIVRKGPDSLYIPFERMSDPVPSEKLEGFMYADDMFQRVYRLRIGETYTVPFVSESSKIQVTKANDANLSAEEIKKVGVLQECDKRIAAGITAAWDKSKIARDILQNFYDGHGHTLDGVKMCVRKNADGSFSIRIEGLSTFKSEYLQADGFSSKGNGNLYDAGGFGEGAKMVNVSLFAKKITDKIRYGSANWTYEFSHDNNFVKMYRELSQNDYYDGNFVEFTTRDNEFVEKLLEAANYFEHSKNPDFQNLIYQNQDMGIAFLGKNKKGNFYLTQRFAYGDKDKYSEGMDGLTIFFRKKPNANFSQGRDRVQIMGDDLDKILDEFVKEISYEDARNIILKMQSCWEQEDEDITKKAYKILLKKLCDKFSYINMLPQIDLTQQKFVAINRSETTPIKTKLRNYGYTLCDRFFESIGMPTADQVLSLYSAHTPLQPTQKEIQKIILMGEAVRIIQQIYKESSKEQVFEEIAQMQPKEIFTDILSRTRGEIALMIPGLINSIQDNNLEMNSELTKSIVMDIFEEIAKNPIDTLEKACNSDAKNYEDGTKAIIEYINQQAGAQLSKEELNRFEPFIKEYEQKVMSILSDYEHCPENEQTFINNLIKICKDEGQELGLSYLKKDIINLFEQKKQKASNNNLIKESNPKSPVFVFNKYAEASTNRLGEAMTRGNSYIGHWIDREHLDNASFTVLLATWLHEMMHQYGGDGTTIFTYVLTDLIGDLFKLNPQQQAKLKAIEKVFNEISQQP